MKLLAHWPARLAVMPDSYVLIRTAFLLLALFILLAPLFGLALGIAEMPNAAWRENLLNIRQGLLLLNSLLFSGTVAITTMCAGVLAALAMKRSPIISRLFYLVLPPLLVIPPYLFGVAWVATFFTINELLLAAGFAGFLVTGWAGSWAAESMALLPLATGFAFLALESINPSLLEAARLHHSEGRVFLRIGLPLALPTLGVGCGFLLVISLMDYSIPSLFATNTYAMEIFSRYSADGSAGVALLTALPLLLIITILLASGISPLRHAAATPWRGGRQFLHGTSWPIWVSTAQYAAVALLLLQAIVPVVMMCWLTAIPARLLQSFDNAQQEMSYSLVLAATVALIGVPLALVLSAQLQRIKMKGIFWWCVILLPLALPASLIGIGMVSMVNMGFAAGLNLAPLAPVLTNLVRFLPIAVLILYAQRLRCDPALLDATQCFQRSCWHGALWVRWPMMAPGMALAATLLFTFTFSELGATLLVAVPGSATIMMRLYNLMHYGASREVAALAITLMAITFSIGVLIVMVVRLMKRGTTPRKGMTR